MEGFHDADLRALPSQLDLHSPADDDLSLEASHHAAILGTGLPTGPLGPHSDAVVPEVPPPIELKSLSETPLHTPLRELQPNFEAVATNALIEFAPVALPTPPPLRVPEKHNLRLPSFDLLGIAVPHPDRKLSEAEAYFAATIGAGPLSKPDDPLHDLSPDLARARRLGDPGGDSPPMEDDTTKPPDVLPPPVATVTPPYESSVPFSWPPFPQAPPAALMDTTSPHYESDNPLSPGLPLSSASNTQPALHIETTFPFTATEWVDEAVAAIVCNLPEASDSRGESVKVLSHALPCPCTPPVAGGHIFHHVIRAIHERLPPKATHWINVFHAVPGRFKLDELPRSPPSTPGPAIGGDDYFTSKVFDSAVQISDYQGDSKLMASPRPVVVPSSVNVSIVERYIPPTNTNEFSEMFSTDGTRSILLDRLAELSPENGMLLFIYPTRTGGRTFMKEYLGPILDPLLRTMTVTHDLPSDLGSALGPMLAVDRLFEYSDARARLESLCRVLSQHGGNASLQQYHQQRRVTYSVVYASKEEVMLDRRVWAEHWWVKQEKPRVREAVTNCFRRARNLQPPSAIIAPDLIQEILSEVASKRAYPPGQEPKRGVEVGVFVVKKSV